MNADELAPGLSLSARAAVVFTAYQDGDTAALGDLVDLLNPLLWHTARAQRLDLDLAQDAVQNAWLRLVDHADGIRDPKALLGWLLITVKREAWALSRGARKVSYDDSGVVDPGGVVADPGDGLFRSEQQEVLWKHVETLPEKCRQLLRIVAFCDRPDYSAVSVALGMPVGSIGPTRGRCLSKLRAALSADPTWER